MIKKLLLLITTFIFILTGCGKGKSSPKGAEGEQLLNLVTWVANHNEWEDIILEFEKENPGIKVKHTVFPTQEYETKIKILLSGGGDIDVFMGKGYEDFVDLSYKGQVTDITERVKKDKLNMKYYGGYANSVYIDNKIYGLPYRTTKEVLYFNKDMFDEKGLDYPIGITYDKFRELANELSEGSGIDKKHGALMFTWPSRSQWYGLQAGDTIIDDDLSSFAKGLQMRIDMEDEGSLYKYNDLVSTNIHYRSEFPRGNIGMMLMGDWAISMFKADQKKGNLNFNWGIAPLPTQEEGKNTTFGLVHPVLISKKSPYQDAAWKLSKFIGAGKGQEIIANNGLTPAYMNQEVKDIYESNNDIENLELILDAKVFMEKPAVEGMTQIERIYQDEFSLVYAREQSVDKAFEVIKKRIKSEVY